MRGGVPTVGVGDFLEGVVMQSITGSWPAKREDYRRGSTQARGGLCHLLPGLSASRGSLGFGI